MQLATPWLSKDNSYEDISYRAHPTGTMTQQPWPVRCAMPRPEYLTATALTGLPKDYFVSDQDSLNRSVAEWRPPLVKGYNATMSVPIAISQWIRNERGTVTHAEPVRGSRQLTLLSSLVTAAQPIGSPYTRSKDEEHSVAGPARGH